MAGFDHACMHWPDGNLVNFVAFDEVELVRLTIFPPIIDGAGWSQPGVIIRNDPALLEKFALEMVQCGEIIGERSTTRPLMNYQAQTIA